MFYMNFKFINFKFSTWMHSALHKVVTLLFPQLSGKQKHSFTRQVVRFAQFENHLTYQVAKCGEKIKALFFLLLECKTCRFKNLSQMHTCNIQFLTNCSWQINGHQPNSSSVSSSFTMHGSESPMSWFSSLINSMFIFAM